MGAIKLFSTTNTIQENYLLQLTRIEECLPKKVVKDFFFFLNISLEDRPRIVEFSNELHREKQFVKQHQSKFDLLTDKELEVFKLVTEGKSTAEISEQLYIESTTVSTHRKHIKQKLELTSMFDWYKFAKAFRVITF